MRRLPARALLAGVALLASVALGAQSAQASLVARGGAIDVVDNAAAVPFPSTATVTGAGTVTKVTVTLERVTHSCPIDLDVQLVSPSGTRVVLMSDAGAPPGGGCPGVEGIDLHFDDDAAMRLPDEPLASGSFRPADYPEDDAESCGPEEGGPAPGLTGASDLAAFTGEDPTGEWRLYVVDDCFRDPGSIAGWELHVGTTVSPFVDVRAPVLDGLAVVPRCLTGAELRSSRGASPSARFRLSERATVAYVVGRRIESRGRDRCPGDVRRGRPGRYETVASLEEESPGGEVSRGLLTGGRAATAVRRGKNAHGGPSRAGPATRGSRRLSLAHALRQRRLRPGTYLLMVVAHDAAGNRSAVARAKFWVLRDR